MQRIFTILYALTPFLVVILAVSQVDNDVVLPSNSTVLLNCSLPRNGTVTWFHNDEKIEVTDDNDKVKDGNLQIDVVHENSGRYRCEVNDMSETFTVYASPNVNQYKKTKNVIEGDPFQVECVAWGTLPLSVTWTFKGVAVVADGDRIMHKNSTSSGRLLENSTLRIQSMEYENEGDYVCVAQNEYGNATATMTVFVKDKLAALWPFLGICVEVVILCTIIFIYEKRRNKRLEEEAAREEADHLNAVDTKPVSDVRQRK